MIDLVSEDILAAGIRLHYTRGGTGKIPLLLLHGITDDGLCWLPLAEALAERCDVIMLDVRGHGKSDAPADGYRYDGMAEEVAQVIRALELHKPVVLGHSMGGIIALALAGLHPDLPGSIILEDAPPFWNLDPAMIAHPGGRNELLEWIEANKRKTHADLLEEAHLNSPEWREADLGPWIDSKHRYSPRIAELVTPQALLSVDFAGLARRITCPALFIQADPQCGATASPADIEKLKAHLPQLQVALIAGAGHSIRRYQFERYLEVVKAALPASPGAG
jgi:pimeloyl-ACP methyl ester carboxylesterase